jgi:uncharacterized protein (TIGR02118 family)
MIKLTFVLRRRPEFEPGEFRRYWREVHAPLVARHAETLRIRRYVQTHTLGSELDAALAEARGTRIEPYDGVAQLWWDSLEDLQAVLSDAAGQQAAGELLEDEQRFLDLPACSLWIGEEHVVVGPESDQAA